MGPPLDAGIFHTVACATSAPPSTARRLRTGKTADPEFSRKHFLDAHGQAFGVLGAMQNASYKLAKARSLAHLKIGVKTLTHLTGFSSETRISTMRDRETMTEIMIPAWVDGTLTPVEKLKAHQRGLRHKAVSVFVMAGDALLIQRRALGKYHTPGLWANTCCTHPDWDEDDTTCAERRLREELGIAGVQPLHRGQVEYRADVGGGLIEHEVVEVFVIAATRALPLALNPDEVMETRWVTLDDLTVEIAATPDIFTPWLRIYLEKHSEMIFGIGA